MFYYQQGDVLLKKIDKLPEGVSKIDTKVLQLGEVTGHKHQFLADNQVEVYCDKEAPSNLSTITPDENKFLVVEQPSALVHEEHDTISIEPGVYQVDIVREFSYDLMEAQRVVD